MTVKENCTVYLTDGNVLPDVDVLMKDNGWIRTGDYSEDDAVNYYPPHMIQNVRYPTPEREGSE